MSTDDTRTPDRTLFDSVVHGLDGDELQRLQALFSTEEGRREAETMIAVRMSFGLEAEPREGFVDEVLSNLASLRKAEPAPLPWWRSREGMQTAVLGSVTGALALFGTGSWGVNPWWASAALVVMFGIGAGAVTNARTARLRV